MAKEKQPLPDPNVTTRARSRARSLPGDSTVAPSQEPQRKMPGHFESSNLVNIQDDPDNDHYSQDENLQETKKLAFDLTQFYDWVPDPDKPGYVVNRYAKIRNEWVEVTDEKDFIAKVSAYPKLYFNIIKRMSRKHNLLKDKAAEQEEQIRDMEDEINALSSQNADGEKLSTEIEAHKKEIEHLRGRVLRRQAAIDRKETELNLSNNQIQTLNETIDRLQKELDRYKNRKETPPPPLPSQERGRTSSRTRRTGRHPSPSNSSSGSLFKSRRNGVPQLQPQRERSYQTPGTTSTADARRRAKVPDPPVFNGDRTKLDEFVSKAMFKLQAEEDYYLAEPKMAVRYLISRTTETAFECLRARHPDFNQTNPFRDPEEVIASLNRQFGEHDRLLKARNEYETIKMKDNESFDEFYTRWEKCVVYLNKTEADQIYELKSRLNKRFYFKVNDGTQYTSLDQVVTRCHNLAYTFTESDLRFPRENRDENAAARTNSDDIPFPEKYKGLPKLTDTLKAQLDKEDRCYGCREVGHRSFDPSCALKIWRDGKTAKLNFASTNQPLAELPNDSNQGNESS